MNRGIKMTISQRFQDIATRLGVEVVSVQEYANEYDGFIPSGAGGGYDCWNDIVIMPSVEDAHFLYMPQGHDSNFTLLHEIIHWTGHADRSGRSVMSEGCESRVDNATEEMTAQLGAQMLAEIMGYKLERCKEVTESYLRSYSYGDLEKATEDAKEAVVWILRQLGDKF